MDYVIHLAALASVVRSMEDPVETTLVNLNGTLHVLLAARDAHVKRVVMAATAAAYGDDPALPRVETQMPQPLSPYALTKLADEYYGQIFNRNFGLEVVALRFFNIFGPRQDPNRLIPVCFPNSLLPISEGPRPRFWRWRAVARFHLRGQRGGRHVARCLAPPHPAKSSTLARAEARH